MKQVAASFIAMAAGWAVMNTALLLVAFAAGWVPLNLSAFTAPGREAFGWLVATAIVVSVAWGVVYLPVYSLVSRTSRFWEWRVCVPVGMLVGAVVPFGLWIIPLAVAEGRLAALLFLLLPATVGGVAAAVGRYLIDWSRGYRDVRNAGTDFGGLKT